MKHPEQFSHFAQEEDSRGEHYNPRKVRKGALKELAVLTPITVGLKTVELKYNLPPILQGHLYDAMAVPCFATMLKLMFANSSLKNNVGQGLGYSFSVEIAQKFHLLSGTYDPIDFVSYTAGALGYIGYEKMNRKIKDAFSNRRIKRRASR